MAEADAYLDMDDLTDIEIGAGLNYEDQTWEVIVKYNGNILEIGQALAVGVEILSENYAIITGVFSDIAKINQLNSYSEIEDLELPKRLSNVLSNGTGRSCIPAVWAGRYTLTGKGILVAIIDSGIDFTHPDFRNADGSSRILYIWDQTAKGIPPDGFQKGVEYDKNNIDTALASPMPFSIIPMIDTNGHGTAVAGVAAGNGGSSNGANRGVAPEASLLVVKMAHPGIASYTRTTEMMRGIKYAVDKAIALKMPLVINLSYGTNNGSHDGSSLFETYINDMSNKWKTSIVVATGNEGVAAHHYMGQINTNEVVDVTFVTSKGLHGFYISMWKNFVDILTVELIMPDGNTSGILKYSEGTKLLHMDGVEVFIRYLQPSHYNEDQEIFFELQFSDWANSDGLWRIRIRGMEIVDGRFNIWLPITEDVSLKTAFTEPSSLTTLTLPSTAKNVISVGAYNTANNSLANFSGQGYTRNNVYIKPDLVAPGVNILCPKINGGYDSHSGTSIAAPFVSGAAALMMEWGIARGNDPVLYGQRLKAFLQLGAQRDSRMQYPNPGWGYGTLCLQRSMEKLREYQYGN